MFRFQRLDRIGLAPSLAAVSALVMLLLTFVTLQLVGYTLARQAEHDIGDQLAELAYQTTDKLDRGVFERYREVKLMAERHEITDPKVPADTKRAVLEGMQSTYSHYAWIGLTDNRGRVRVSTKRMLEGLDVSARPWFGAAYEGVHLQDVHEAVLLAKLLPSSNGEPKRFFDIAFPYRGPDGVIAGVLGTHLSWQWTAEVERSVLRPLAERKAVDTLILSKGGAVLLGPKEYADRVLDQQSFRQARRDRNGWVVEDWPDGKRYLVGYSLSQGHANYPGLGWTVVVRQPVDVAFEPVESLRRQILWAGLGTATLVSLLVWLLSRNITRPLARIARYAEALHAGQLQQTAPVPSRLTEVQMLQGALDTLLSKLFAKQQSLRDLNATLEARVAERTQELDAAVADTRRNERRVRAVIDGALDAFVGVDTRGRITDWNPRAEEIFGWTRDDVLGKNVSDTIIPPRFREAHEAGMRRFALTGSSGVVGKRLQLFARRSNGEEFPVEMSIALVSADDTHFFGTFIQDISARKQIEDELAHERELLKEAARRLEASERNLRTVTDNVPVLIGYIDGEERYRFANATYEQWYGVPVGDIVGKTVRELVGKKLYQETRQQLQRVLAGEQVRFELEHATPDGLRTIEITGIPDIEDGAGKGSYILGADITAAKLHAAELQQLARSDTLTGLPNRRDYLERLQAALQRGQRSGHAVALMFLDVDHFKQVNDTLGHAAGDAVLCEFARRVRAAVRVTDTVCRLAGDEFTIILEGLKAPDEAALVAQKILKAFERPFSLEQGERRVSTSIGVAYADRFPIDIAALSEEADKALYMAKSRGRRCFAVSSVADAGIAL